MRTAHRGRWLLIAGSAMLAACLALPASADEADARRIVKAMSDYLAAQATLSFDYDSTLEVVTADGMKVDLASSGTVAMERPDKLRMTRTGGFADVEFVFDGETLSLYGKNLDAYAQVAAPGTVDQLVGTLRDTYHLGLPGADLLVGNLADDLLPLAETVFDLGSGVIHGTECDHLAFRGGAVDVQLWIAQGDAPRPCRLVVTSRDVEGQPQYTIDVTGWNAGDTVAAAEFTFVAPAGATKVEPSKLADLDELPSHFTPGDAK